MTQENLDKLKNALPLGLTITSSIDYPNGIQNQNGFLESSEPFAKVTGIMGPYGIVITWFYERQEDRVEVDYLAPNDGNVCEMPFSELREFLLSLKNKNKN